jgi:diguanylate cyclase (GGDEF)-like protein
MPESKHKAAAMTAQAIRILLVDRVCASRKLVAACLFDMGYSVAEAADGSAAVALYQQDRPDLILLDVEMPANEGCVLIKEFRQLDGDYLVPIMFLIDRTVDDEVERWIEAGCDDYVTKPINSAALRIKLGAMCRITDMRKKLLQMSEELQDTNRALVKLSSLDGLTNVLNRRSFDAALEVEWHRGLRTGMPLALTIGDIDYFKRYNDTYGHVDGGQCLRSVAAVLSKTARRQSDLVAQYGGDEFVILMTNTSEQLAVQIGQLVLDAVRSLQIPHVTSDIAQYVTMSLGISVCVPNTTSSPKALLKAADEALYKSKDEGRDRATLVAT